jgi:hypothetical protein
MILALYESLLFQRGFIVDNISLASFTPKGVLVAESDVRCVGIDFRPFLCGGTIDDVSTSVSVLSGNDPAAAIVIASPENYGSIAFAWVGSFVAGVKYLLTFTVETSLGETRSAAVILRCVSFT